MPSAGSSQAVVRRLLSKLLQKQMIFVMFVQKEQSKLMVEENQIDCRHYLFNVVFKPLTFEFTYTHKHSTNRNIENKISK